MLQHYVFLKYQTGTPDAHIQAFGQKILALQNIIEEIQHVELGRDELHDERSWDLVLVMQFKSIADLRIYQQHPDHVAAAQFNNPYVANVGSLDFHQ